MKKSIKAYFKIYIPIYRTQVVCSFGETDAELRKHILNKVEDKQLEAAVYDGSHAYCYELSYGTQLVRVRQLPTTPYQYAELSHEILHAAIGILRSKNVQKIDGSTEEVLAYLFHYIIEEVYKKLNHV